MTPSVRAPQPLVIATGIPAGPDPTKNWAGFLELARRRFQLAAEAERTIRQEALEDLKFYAGDQWPQQTKADRDLTHRPCLTINRLPQFAKQVINAQRQARPSIQVNPVGDGADVDTAEILQGLTRHIEINSDAEIAYDTAFEHAVISGFGYFRLTTEYVDENSFDQEIRITRILNPFAVYYDPTAQKPDKSDAEYCFVIEDIPLDQYKRMHPDSELCGLSDFRSIGDGERDWFINGSVRVAEYFFVEKEEKFLVKLADGRTVTEDELTEDDEIAVWNGNPLRRIAEVRKVRWAKINAREVMEPNDGEPATWPGKWIPIVPVIGDELIVDGKKKLIGIVRHAKDAQRMYNYARTGIVEQLALSSKAPWIVAEGQIEGHEEAWRQSNVRTLAVLTYKPKAVGNEMVPPPIRNTFEPPIHGLTASLAQSNEDLMATTGMYTANVGQRDPAAESGKAIMARKEQGEMANSNLLDNLSRSIRHAGRAVLDLIPHIYDVPRVVRIVNPDQSHKMVQINQQFDENGVSKIYDVTTGRYDVTVSVGPSYQSKRQEFVQSVLSLVQAAPQTMQFVMDLLVSNMDWPGAKEIAERLKKMLPPQLQEQDDPNQQQPIPQQVQQQLQMLMQQNAALIKQLENSTSIINTKRLELESRERIAALQAQATIIAAELKARSSNAETLAKLEFDSIHKRLDLLHEDEPIEAETAAPQQAQGSPQAAPQPEPPPGPPGMAPPSQPPAPSA